MGNEKKGPREKESLVRKARNSAGLTQEEAFAAITNGGLEMSLKTFQTYDQGKGEPPASIERAILDILAGATSKPGRPGAGARVYGVINEPSLDSRKMPERPITREVIFGIGPLEVFRISFTVEGMGEPVMRLDLGRFGG